MAEELIYKVGVEGTNELNKLENSVDKAGKSVGKTKLYMSELRTELRKARGDLIKYAEGTDEYNRALARGSQITAQINEANGKMRAGVQDLGDTTKNVTSTMVGFAGGFQVVQSTMSLFGIENEETIKTVLRLQQTMSIVQGLSAFAQGIDNAQDLIAAFRASNHQLNEELKTTSEGMEGVSKSTGKMGESMGGAVKESAVLGSNLAGNTKISEDLSKGLGEVTNKIEESDKATKAFSLSFAEFEKAVFGPGGNMDRTVLAGLSQALDELEEGGLDSVNNIAKNWIEKNTEIGASVEQVTEAMEKEIEVLKVHVEESKKAYGSLKKHTKVNKEAEEQTKKTTKATEDLGKSSKGAGKGFSSFTKSIGKSLLTMGAFLAVIWAVTAGISWLIKKLAEVPEDVKIKLELETNALNSYIASLNRIKNFVREYNQAIKDSNKNYLKQLDETAKKEFNKNQADLDAIKKRGKMTEDFFTAYLKMAKDTYFNEALAKLRSEKEVALLIAKEEEKSAQKLKDQRREENKGESGFVTLGRWIFTKDQVKKARKEGEKIQKELDTLDKIKYKEVKSPFVDEDTGGGDTRTPASKAPTLQDRRPDAVEDDATIQLLRERNALTRELTNEELVIYEENMRKKDTLQDDSEIAYTEYQIRLGQARALDLENQKEYLQDSLDKTETYYAEELENNNNKLVDATNAHNEELGNLREYNQKKFDIEAQAQALLEERQGLDGKKDADKIKAIDAEIEALNDLYRANNDNISQSKDLIADHKAEIAIIEEKLKVLDGTPEEIARMKDEITQLNLAIADNSAFLVDSLSANMKAMMEQATFYLDTMASTFNGLESMTGDFMQAEDNKLAKEKNNLELSQAYREADSEQQQQMMYELELANYEAKKKTFETNKAFQIGGVVATSAANQMDIIKAWLDPKTGGPLSPANIAVAAAATIANVTTTLGSIKQISSTSLEKPVPPLSGSGGSGGVGANIALSPNKTSLTSKEENLNSMYKSGKMDDRDTVVKVSEINNVQKRVKVREKNSSY